MADKEIPGLDPVTTPAATDIFGVRQTGDTEDRRETRAQVHNIQSGEHFILALVNEPATPTLAFGDGDSGFFEDSDDSISKSIAGVVQAVTGPDGKLFINTLTGTGFQGSNIVSATPANVEIFAAGSATNAVDGGKVELWGGYAAGNAPARGGDVILWGGGAGGSDPTGGDVLAFGGEAEISPGDIILTGGVATIQGTGGFVAMRGGAGFGANGTGGRADLIGGAATGTRDGGDCRVFSGASGAGAGADGGEIQLTAGNSASSSGGVGGAILLRGGVGAGTTGTGGHIDITGGLAPGGGVIGVGGAVTITGGANNGSQSAGGAVSLTGGAATGANNSPGGAASLVGGVGRGTADGGAVDVTGGLGGPTDTSAGGAVTIAAGTSAATNGDGGDINLTVGPGTGSGVDGDINFTGNILSSSSQGPAILDEQATFNNPTLVPDRTDLDTGIGQRASDSLVLTVGGDAGMDLIRASNQVQTSYLLEGLLTAFAGGGQGSAVALNASYTNVATVATAGDSVRLSAVFRGGAMMYVMNSGAEAMDVFPSSGDDLGQGVDTAVSVAAGEGAIFMGITANSIWVQLLSGGSGIATAVLANTADGPQILDASATATVPTLIPDRSDPNTGVGGVSDRLDLIAGGIQGLRVDEGDEDPGDILIAYPTQETAITAFATGGQANAFQLGMTISVITTCATTNDSVKLMRPSVVGAWVYVRNDGAETCEMFPFSGDDLGQGVDVSVFIAPGQVRVFISTTASGNNWVEMVGTVADSLIAQNVAGPSILDEAATSTNPTLVPNRSDDDTGIGWTSADRLALIAGGVLVAELFETAGADPQLILIQNDDAARPTLAFGDGDTGFYENGDDFLSVTVAGVRQFAWATGLFQGIIGGAGAILNEATTATNPTLLPFNTDTDTGLGSDGSDSLDLISGGVNGMAFTELNSNVLQAPDAQIGLTAFATGGQGSATQVNSSYAVFSTVATLDDSGKLPPVFKVNSIIIVKNDGAADMAFFPATGDDLGAGTNTAVTIVAGTAAKFIATVADSTWTQIAPVVAV